MAIDGNIQKYQVHERGERVFVSRLSSLPHEEECNLCMHRPFWTNNFGPEFVDIDSEETLQHESESPSSQAHQTRDESDVTEFS